MSFAFDSAVLGSIKMILFDSKTENGPAFSLSQILLAISLAASGFFSVSCARTMQETQIPSTNVVKYLMLTS